MSDMQRMIREVEFWNETAYQVYAQLQAQRNPCTFHLVSLSLDLSAHVSFRVSTFILWPVIQAYVSFPPSPLLLK